MKCLQIEIIKGDLNMKIYWRIHISRFFAVLLYLAFAE